MLLRASPAVRPRLWLSPHLGAAGSLPARRSMSAAGPKAAQPARSADWFHPYEEQIRAAGAWDAEALVRGMKRRVAECNAGEEVLKRGEFVPFCVPGCSQPLGYIKAR